MSSRSTSATTREEALRIEGAAEATVRWRAHMREYFMPEVATEGVIWLSEIFRLE